MPDPTPTPHSTDPNHNPETAGEHQKKEALAAFTATLHSVGTNLEAPLLDRASTISSNAIALQRQETELAASTARLARQNAQWAGLADETRDGLKEIGDVQNWAEMIERDLLVLEDMMDDVEGVGYDSDSGGGGGSHHRNGGEMEMDEESDGGGHGNGRVAEVGGGNGISNGDTSNGNGNADNLKKLKKPEEVRKGWFSGWW
ncbi:hypothetical protein N7533_005028 [Penicillium manginii]|uniref:uncharacterized protein n=1 Tax=Penicillium manginii TaxID=203109 RepID=UPI002548B237|nr:uncharacterized protein N7533_005028 [Penicillium manginii]KAJ5755485.1 hypothetical protein N7533_005028 [Penicillium manginii]